MHTRQRVTVYEKAHYHPCSHLCKRKTWSARKNVREEEKLFDITRTTEGVRTLLAARCARVQLPISIAR